MIILFLYPESLLSASFQLSFAAVIALIAFYESGWQHLLLWAKYGGKPRKFALYFGGIFLSTLIASTATTFYSIQFFNRMTLQSILGNLLSIPLTSFVIMPLAFFSTLVLPLVHLFHYVLFPFEVSLKALVDVAGFVSHLPGAALLIPSPPFAYGVLVTFGGLFLCLNQNRKRLFGLIPILLGGLLCFIPQKPMILMSLKELAYFDGNVLYTTNSSNSFELSFWIRHLGLTKERVVYGGHVIDIAFKTQHDIPLVLVGDPWKMMKKQRLELCDCNTMIITNGYKNYLCPNQNAASSPSATTKAVVDRKDLKTRGNCFLMDLSSNAFPPLMKSIPLVCTNDVCKGYPWCFY
jgi:competence protein ComEC